MLDMFAPKLPDPAQPRPRSWKEAFIALLIVMLLVAWGLITRGEAQASLEKQAATGNIPTVAITHPKAGPADEEVVLPGEVRGEFETSLYARTNGYVRSWKADIGTRVKAGELLAVIDAPELDQQLHQAQADLETARANAQIARNTAQRVQGLVETRSVSRQEGEDRSAAADATAAQVVANQANVDRLRQLQSFERITAPFEGVITARSTDVGALINNGAGKGTELFRIAAIDRLRTYVDVPQSYAASVQVGSEAQLQFPDRPGHPYPAKVTRTASAIEPQARTLRVELDIDNAKGELLPGSFVQVHFKFPTDGHSLRLPGNVLLFRAEGTRVALVRANNTVALKPIELGRDFGDSVEVLTGLQSTDQVIVNPTAAIDEGDRVIVAAAKEPKAGS